MSVQHPSSPSLLEGPPADLPSSLILEEYAAMLGVMTSLVVPGLPRGRSQLMGTIGWLSAAEVGGTQRGMAPEDIRAPVAEVNPAHRQFFHPHAMLDLPRDPPSHPDPRSSNLTSRPGVPS